MCTSSRDICIQALVERLGPLRRCISEQVSRLLIDEAAASCEVSYPHTIPKALSMSTLKNYCKAVGDASSQSQHCCHLAERGPVLCTQDV